uniref:PDZ domain-containing protein n=1 Tax=Amphiprion percula TaxID=161767 RepID=A0A3P8TZS7_AMPPE
MSKTAVKKLHWRSKVQDSFVPLLGSSGELGIAVGGGADYGEFPFVTSAPGGGLTVGDIILEIGGTPVLGMTLGDVRGILNSCPHPIRIKTVSPGSTLCKDLRLYLSKCFTPGSVDSQLQQVIRENLYLRAVPCKSFLELLFLLLINCISLCLLFIYVPFCSIGAKCCPTTQKDIYNAFKKKRKYTNHRCLLRK